MIALVLAGCVYLVFRAQSTDEKVDAKFEVMRIERVSSFDVLWARFSQSDWFGEFSGTVVAEVDSDELHEFFDRSHADGRWLRLAVPPEDGSVMILNGTTMQRLVDRPEGSLIDTPSDLSALVSEHLPAYSGRHFLEIPGGVTTTRSWIADYNCLRSRCGLIITMVVT